MNLTVPIAGQSPLRVTPELARDQVRILTKMLETAPIAEVASLNTQLEWWTRRLDPANDYEEWM